MRLWQHHLTLGAVNADRGKHVAMRIPQYVGMMPADLFSTARACLRIPRRQLCITESASIHSGMVHCAMLLQNYDQKLACANILCIY